MDPMFWLNHQSLSPEQHLSIACCWIPLQNSTYGPHLPRRVETADPVSPCHNVSPDNRRKTTEMVSKRIKGRHHSGVHLSVKKCHQMHSINCWALRLFRSKSDEKDCLESIVLRQLLQMDPKTLRFATVVVHFELWNLSQKCVYQHNMSCVSGWLSFRRLPTTQLSFRVYW